MNSEDRAQWLLWGRKTACKLDSLLCIYLDPAICGPFDKKDIPRGGPYSLQEPRIGATHEINFILKEIGATTSKDLWINQFHLILQFSPETPI